MNERLSSLVDGQLEAQDLAETLDEVVQDEALRAVWARYHLIGQVLRREPVSVDCQEIADRVRLRLTEETVVPLPPRMPQHRPAWLGSAIGYALAASVALVAVFALPPLFEQTQEPRNQLALQDLPNAKRYFQDVGERSSQGQPGLDARLNSYLVNHQEYIAGAGMKGLLPYATFVSYEGRR